MTDLIDTTTPAAADMRLPTLRELGDDRSTLWRGRWVCGGSRR